MRSDPKWARSVEIVIWSSTRPESFPSSIYSYKYITFYIKSFSLNKFSPSPRCLITKVVVFSFKIIEFDGRHYDLIKFEFVHFLKDVISVLYNKICPWISIDWTGLLIWLDPLKSPIYSIVIESYINLRTKLIYIFVMSC